VGFLFFTLICFLSYLALTAGSGDVLRLWSVEEIATGAVVSLLVAALSSRIIPRKVTGQVINPLRWMLVIFYIIGPFFLSLVLANIEVLYRIITRKIKPAIISVESNLKSETGAYILANSITLSPGTLSLHLEPESHRLYIHCLYWDRPRDYKAEPRDVAGIFYWWIKKIFE